MLINKLDNIEINVEDGHKYAVCDIKKGENIIKYGMPIGHATEDIKKGEHVHTHNVKTKPWKGYVKPFRLWGNLYFVGTEPASTHIIGTGEGLIMLDSGYQQSLYLVLHNMHRLGLNPYDLKYIIHTHTVILTISEEQKRWLNSQGQRPFLEDLTKTMQTENLTSLMQKSLEWNFLKPLNQMF